VTQVLNNTRNQEIQPTFSETTVSSWNIDSRWHIAQVNSRPFLAHQPTICLANAMKSLITGFKEQAVTKIHSEDEKSPRLDGIS
jgi:hypothetical protein